VSRVSCKQTCTPANGPRAGELLPLENGVLRLHTKELIPYSPEMWFNWRLPYRYESGADCPTIKWWLNYVTQGDQELAALLRAWMRAVLTGRHDLQKFLELIGPGGTGKSTFMLLCTLLVGETNQVSTNLQNLENNRFEGALLYGKRLVLITDSERYGGAISILKGITGGDPIRYERKNRQQQAPFIFTGLVMIAANEQVQNTDYTSGLVRRWISVNFSKHVTQEEREDWDKKGGLLNAMKKELPGLLNELLAMGDEEVTRIIGNPGAATWTANRQAMIHQNPMAAWLEDQVVADPAATPYIGAKREIKDPITGLTTLKDVGTKLYPNYLRWVYENGQHHPIALRRFTVLLLDICCTLGIKVEKLGRNSAGTPIKGIRGGCLTSTIFFVLPHLKILPSDSCRCRPKKQSVFAHCSISIE
jgi:putative DNA primase/helicase